MAALATWAFQKFILVPLGITFLQTISFILVIAALVQLVEMIIQKISPPLYRAPGHLPSPHHDQLRRARHRPDRGKERVQHPGEFRRRFSAASFLLAIILMSSSRETDTEWVPKPLRGIPIAFITGGLMALAFMAFDKPC
jgi:electron transport complex protein RnfA